MAQFRVSVIERGNGIPQFATRWKSATLQALAALAQEAASIAFQLAPKRTGYMASTIAVELTRTAAFLTVGAYYWIFLEFGTIFMDAQPFIRPAVAAVQGRIFEVFRGAYAGL